MAEHDQLAAAVADAMPWVMARIPPTPAAELGRLHVPPQAGGRRSPTVRAARPTTVAATGITTGPFASSVGIQTVRPTPPVRTTAAAPTRLRRVGRVMRAAPPGTGTSPIAPGRPPGEVSPVLQALRSLGDLLPERLLGALELAIPDLVIAAPDRLTGAVPPGATGPLGFASRGGENEAGRATTILAGVRPGATELVAELGKALAAHDLLGELLTVEGDGDEATLAARHGTAYLALAVVVATAMLRELGGWTASTPAIVGTALGSAVLLLEDAPMPTGYADAVLEKRRAEYRLPRGTAGQAEVHESRFALTEGPFPESPTFAGNGLAEVVSGGVAIRTGVNDGTVPVHVRVLKEPPENVDLTGWDEVVELSWTAPKGFASIAGSDQLRDLTPPWPGEYRLRVHAADRDDPDADGRYQLWVWSAPTAPEIVHKRTDRLGHRLRGEPEPAARPQPEKKYRWVRKGALEVAATITVVTNATVEEVLRGFGADPERPESLDDLSTAHEHLQWVAVLPLGSAVLAVEENGYQGAGKPVLEAISRRGRAASMFWNVNALTRLSLAENGAVLAAFEPGLEPIPAFHELLDDLDLDDYRRRVEKGLVGVERFTGHEVLPEHLDRVWSEDVAYRVS